MVGSWRTRSEASQTSISQLLPSHIALSALILTEGISAGIATHIIRFDLISADGGTMTLGYRLPGSQVTADLCNRSLRGFKVVADDRGICALRPVFNGETTSWIDDPQQDPTTNLIKIALEHEVKHIAVKFDVIPFRIPRQLSDWRSQYCKMVSLSIA